MDEGPDLARDRGMVRTRASRGPGLSNARFFIICLVLTFANFAAWSLASPLFSAPDEPTQVVRAAAVVRGELVGSTIGSVTNATTGVTVPAVYNSGPPYTACFAFHPDVPASCAAPIKASGRSVRTTTYAGRYPPLYYLVVGLPSLASTSVTGLYLVRLMSALVNALFIALALFTIARWSRRRLLFVAVMAASTPMVWFLGGVVNPSGLEVCAAICLWVAGFVLVTEHATSPPRGLVAVVGFTAAVFMLVRPLSPLWVALTIAVLALAGGGRSVVSLFKDRMVQMVALPLAACGAVAVWWIETKHSLDLLPVGAHLAAGTSTLGILGAVFSRVPWWLHQMVGIFGALDTPSPPLTYGLWSIVVGGACVAALMVGRWRERAALAGLILCVVFLPVAIAFSQYHRLGIVWQGRDILPLATGVPVLAVGIAQDSAAVGRWRGWIAMGTSVAMGIASVVAFLEALRRYTVGASGPLNFLAGTWHPPLGILGVAIADIVVVGLLLTWTGSLGCRSARRPLLTMRRRAPGVGGLSSAG